MVLTPLCQKELRGNDINNELTFPTHALAAFGLPQGVLGTDFQAFDADNVPWIFHLSIRPGKHPKPVILKSTWNPFVVNKQLREGDKVVFFTEQTDDGTRFHVRAQRKYIKILGGGDDDGKDYVDVDSLSKTNEFFSVW